MDTNSGFIILPRGFFKTTFWRKKRKFNETEAWLDIIQRAQYHPTEELKGWQDVKLEKGELIVSILGLSERWKWSQGKVNRFLKYLENEMNEIRRAKRDNFSIITICNYNSYQNIRTYVNDKTENERRMNGEQTESERRHTTSVTTETTRNILDIVEPSEDGTDNPKELPATFPKQSRAALVGIKSLPSVCNKKPHTDSVIAGTSNDERGKANDAKKKKADAFRKKVEAVKPLDALWAELGLPPYTGDNSYAPFVANRAKAIEEDRLENILQAIKNFAAEIQHWNVPYINCTEYWFFQKRKTSGEKPYKRYLPTIYTPRRGLGGRRVDPTVRDHEIVVSN